MPDYGLSAHWLELDLKVDLEKFKFWLHFPQSGDGWTPMFTWVMNEDFGPRGSQRAAQFLQVPTTKGSEWKQKNGGCYCRTLAVMDPEEQKKRAKIYRERIRPFVEDIDKVWEEGGYKDKLLGAYERIQATDMKKLDDVGLCEFFENEILPMHRMQSDFHWIFGFVFFRLPILFWEECNKYGMSHYDPLLLTLLEGVDNKFVTRDIETWKLSRLAIKLDIDKIFHSNKPDDVLPKLRESEAGRKWLKELDGFLKVWGYTMPRVFEVITPTWIEDPTPVIINVTRHLGMTDEDNPELKQKAQAEKREKAEKEFLSKIPAAERKYMSTLMKATQKCSRWSDEHSYYLDDHDYSLIRLWSMEAGRRLVEKGYLDSPDDIFFLIPDEILRWFYAPEYYDWRSVVKKRRQVWEENREKAHTQEGYWPPFIAVPDCSPQEILTTSFMDPAMAALGAGTLEPPPYPDIKADLYGKPGAPGEGEGPAHIVFSDKELAEVKKGEVMVCMAIYPAWGVVYPLVSAVVIEMGGLLNHGAILGREYGVPVAVGIADGTKKIKPGQRIKVDGTKGLVFLLDK
jgi:pyruvate,water dikinase